MAYTRERLGEMLVRAGLITDEQLDSALLAQQRDGGKIGQILVRELHVTEDQIAATLADQKGLAHVTLAGADIDRAVALMLPLGMVRRRGVIPIKVEGDVLTLAMADPLDVEAIDEAELRTGLSVEPVVAAASQVAYAIEKYVAGGDAMAELELVSRDEEAEAAETPDIEDGAAIVRLVNQLIREAVLEKASDVHIEPTDEGINVRYRVDGVLRPGAKLPKRTTAELLSRIKVMADLDIAERRRPQDGRIALKVDGRPLDLRVATLPTPAGEAITLRILDREVAVHTLDEIGIRDDDRDRLDRMLSRPFGALLVSGPTGSGKSTTLYAILQHINDPGRKVITVEDPIEYQMEGVTQVAVNARIGLTFAAGLRTILRSDPDIVMVGEVRDPETAEIAVRAALTGHLVLTSIHTNDAPSALTRLADMGVPPYITTSGLIGAVAQRLVRKLCPHCKAPVRYDAERLRAAGFSADEVEEGLELYGPSGCEECGMTGYRGRIGVFEVMEFDEHLAQLYLHEASAEDLRHAAMGKGMRPLRRDALDKVAAGITSLAEIDRVVV